MTAFAIGWGVFWLLIWLFVMGVGLCAPRQNDDSTSFVAAGMAGVGISAAWIVSFVIVRVLS